MARYAELPDGTRLEFPDNTADAVIDSVVKSHLSGQPAMPKGSAIKDIAGGVAQGLTNIGASSFLNPVTQLVGGGLSHLADVVGASDVAESLRSSGGMSGEQRRESAKQLAAQSGANPESWAYLGGELVPEFAVTGGVAGVLGKGAAAIGAEKVAHALRSAGMGKQLTNSKLGTAAARVAGGATVGAGASGLVSDNVGAGAAVGGVLGAAGGKIGDVAERIAQKVYAPKQLSNEQLEQSVLEAVDAAKRELADSAGIEISQIPQADTDFLKAQIAAALKEGKKLDAVAALRKREFESLGINPMQGQITRDPTQYAQERNLRGASPEIAGRLSEQNRALQSVIGEPAATATEQYQAGSKISDILRRYGENTQQDVGALYGAARNESGRGAAVDHIAFVDAANNALDSQMLGRFLPDQARGLLNDISSGKIPLNVNNLVQVDSVLSAAQRNSDAAGQKAIGAVRDALNNAPIASSEGEVAKAAFDTARKAARERFSEIDANPALAAAIEGKHPDTFVRDYLVRGKVDDVTRLADLLRKQSPDAFAQAKAQIAADIKRAAFGETSGTESAVRPEMLSKKLREIGTKKLGALFTPDELARYQTAAKVAAYIEKHPNAAPVNTSNTLVAQLMNIPAVGIASKVSSHIPLVNSTVALAKAAKGAIDKQKAVTSAINAKVPTTKIELDESKRRLLARILGGSSGGVIGQLTAN